MIENPILLVALLALHVAVSEWLVKHTVLRHLGTALLVIVLVAITANLGLLPTYSDEIPVYRGIFAWVAPVAIFWLLLQVRLKEVLRAGRSVLVLFLIGSLGTFIGVMLGMRVVGGADAFGELHFALGGMFIGTYTGGSVNYNAIALHYGVVEEGVLYAGAAAVDSLMTTIWMAITLSLPRLLGSRDPAPAVGTKSDPLDPNAGDAETVHPMEVAWLVFLALGVHWFSERSSEIIAAQAHVEVPSILILTTIALILAQLPVIQRLRGTTVLGMFAVYLFLAVIGALCDVGALREIGSLGASLFVFVLVIVTVHGLVTFGAALALRADPVVAAVASQANIGGGTSALALARSLSRQDLVLPAILVGSLGNALGTYLGFLGAKLLS